MECILLVFKNSEKTNWNVFVIIRKFKHLKYINISITSLIFQEL